MEGENQPTPRSCPPTSSNALFTLSSPLDPPIPCQSCEQLDFPERTGETGATVFMLLQGPQAPTEAFPTAQPVVCFGAGAAARPCTQTLNHLAHISRRQWVTLWAEEPKT